MTMWGVKSSSGVWTTGASLLSGWDEAHKRWPNGFITQDINEAHRYSARLNNKPIDSWSKPHTYWVEERESTQTLY